MSTFLLVCIYLAKSDNQKSEHLCTTCKWKEKIRFPPVHLFEELGDTMSLGFDLNGKYYETDEDGYLQKLEDWNEDIARYIAKMEGIEMNEDHWKIIYYLRGYYEEYKIAPMIRILLKWIKKNLGPEKGTNEYLYKLFPRGPAKQACKIAGMAKPTGCI